MSALETIGSYSQKALAEVAASGSQWLSLLQGPDDPTFRPNTRFEGDWISLLRLIVTVSGLLAVIIGVEALKSRSLNLENPFLVWTLVVGAIVASLYSLTSVPFFRLGLTIPQVFFIFVLLGLPWIPVFAGVRTIFGLLPGTLKGVGIILDLSLTVLSVRVFYNLARGIAIVSGRSTWIALLSILLPICVPIGLLIWWYWP